jgi:hypothetical protein
MLPWIHNLETAKNVGEVVNLARDCVAHLPKESVVELPAACRTRELHAVDDLRWWSERLSEEYWRRRGLGADVHSIHDVWSFFLRASIQSGRLATRRGVTSAS